MKNINILLVLIISCIRYLTFAQTNPTSTISDAKIASISGNNTNAKVMACPPTAPLTASLVSTNVAVANNSTVGCNQPFYIKVTDATTIIDPQAILTPCWKIEFNPLANLDTRGTANFYENTNLFATLCPTCALNIGSSSFHTPATITSWLANGQDYTAPHYVELCNGNQATGASTVTIKGCWTNTVLSGPIVWNTSTAGCFTIGIPANSPSTGTADYSITPVAGSVGLTDHHDGSCNIDPSVMPTGTTYTVTYRFNSPTCGIITGTYKFTIPPTPTLAAISDQTVCSGSTVNSPAFATSPSGGTFSWSNDNTSIGLAASGTGSISSYIAPSVATATTGVITVTPTFSGCIGASGNFSITINPQPTTTLTVSDASVCLGSTISFTAGTADTYTWSGSAGNGLAGVSGPTVSSTPTAAGSITYTVNLTAVNGCTNTISQTIDVISNPTITVNNPTTCLGVGTVLTANGAATYSWSTGATTQTINVGPVTQTVYTVTGTTSGCSSSNTATVFISPSLSVTVNSPVICSGSSTVLIAGGATNYTWSTGETTSSINVSPNSTTIYTVAGEASGCTGNNTTTVTVNPIPIISVNNATLCAGLSTVLTATGAVSYTWSTTETTSSINTSPISTTVYTVIGTSNAGCSGVNTATVTVNPVPIVSISSATICQGKTATLTAIPSLTGGGFVWMPNGQTTPSITNSPSSTTNYSVLYTLNTCTAIATGSIVVNPIPVVTLSANSGTINAFESVSIAASGGGTYVWSTGETSSVINPTLQNTTTYCATVTSVAGCINSNCITIVVENPSTLSIPNVFTPNGDGTNDMFFTPGNNISSYSLKIFNRWGQMLFSSEELLKGWNGTVNGQLAPDGVYLYILDAKGADDVVYKKQGHITLVH